AQQVLHPLAHLAGRLVGEGHGGDVAGIDAHLLDQPEDAVGDDPGLAGPRAGEDELRPLAMRDGGDLLRVELPFELERDGLLHAGSLSEGVGGWQGGASARFRATVRAEICRGSSLGRSDSWVDIPGNLRCGSSSKPCGGITGSRLTLPMQLSPAGASSAKTIGFS